MARGKRAMHARRQLRDAAGKFAAGMQLGCGCQWSSTDGCTQEAAARGPPRMEMEARGPPRHREATASAK